MLINDAEFEMRSQTQDTPQFDRLPGHYRTSEIILIEFHGKNVVKMKIPFLKTWLVRKCLLKPSNNKEENCD